MTMCWRYCVPRSQSCQWQVANIQKACGFWSLWTYTCTSLGTISYAALRLLRYGNHWHMLLWPRNDGDVSEFMRWVTLTHTQRWHASHGTAGVGHVYQGRFKSFPVQSDAHYLKVTQYIESNPLRAGLVKNSCDWQYSSLAIRNNFSKRDLVLMPARWSCLLTGTGMLI